MESKTQLKKTDSNLQEEGHSILILDQTWSWVGRNISGAQSHFAVENKYVRAYKPHTFCY
jgi:hypothetical protein